MNKKQVLCLTVAVQLISLMFCFSAGAGWTVDFLGGTDFPPLRAISGTGPDNIFAGGDSGKMIHYDGTQWKEQNTGFTDRVFGLYCAAEDDVFAATEWGKIYRYDGSVWTLVFNTATMTKVRGIWGSSANDVYAVGDDVTGLSGVLVHFDGDSWTEQVGFFSKPPKGVYGIDSDNVFVIGGPVTTNATNGGFLDYYDGSSWTTLIANAPSRFKAVWADNNTVFAVGDQGYAVSIDLVTEDQTDHDTQATEDLRAVWGSSKNDVFAVGNAGVIQHYDGTAWTTMDSGMSDDEFFGVWGTGPDNVYAVTRYGSAILHYDGNPDNPTTCPFEEAVDSRQDLVLLRAYRDSLAADFSGLLLTKLFYFTAPDAAEILRSSNDLKQGLKTLVENNRAAVKDLTVVGSAVIDKAQKDELLLYINDMKQQAGLGLGIVLTAVEYGIRLGWLMDLYHVSVE